MPAASNRIHGEEGVRKLPLTLLRDSVDGAWEFGMWFCCFGGDYDVGSVLCAAQCDGFSDAATRARDEHRSARQIPAR